MVLLVDHNDSFTNLLADLLRQCGADVEVINHSEIESTQTWKYSAIVIGPGPGRPSDYPDSMQLIAGVDGRCSVLGICLGMQMLNEVERGETVAAKTLMHGKTSQIKLDAGSRLFAGLPDQIEVARYHSLAVKLPDDSPFRETAVAEDGEIMAIEHKHWNDIGVQFHPESFMSPQGLMIIKNFLELR